MEILAPAGSFESVLAAVANGANAVYLGLKNLSARQNAVNFSEEELKQTVEFCHARNVAVYLTVNTLVLDIEFKTLHQTLSAASKAGVDALIIQDLGVMRYIKKACPQMKIHASTQMTIHSVAGAEQARKLGFERIVLSRELSLANIKDITEKVDIQTEIFIHGALCMCVSGQCYMSAMIGGRSANKGNCAGTCRMPHSTGADKNEYALSLKDLCATSLYENLDALNVTSLKIEGRMKRPEYVAAVTKAYANLKQGDTPDTEMLRAVFSRSGFTDGYLNEQVGSQMFGHRTKDDVNATTSDILKQLAASYHKHCDTVPLKMSISVKRNQPMTLTAEDNCANRVTVTGATPQEAINRAADSDYVTASLMKLGDTAYYLHSCECDIDDGLAVSKSALNELRRSAATKLTQKRLARPECELFDYTEVFKRRSTILNKAVRATFSEFSQIPFDFMDKLEFIYLPIEEVLEHIDSLKQYADKLIISLPRFMLNDEDKLIGDLEKLVRCGFTKVSVSNLSHIKIAKDLHLQMYGTAFLNIVNSYALKQYEEFGVCDTQLSCEMTVPQINNIASTCQKVGVTAYGNLSLMLTVNPPAGDITTTEIYDKLGNKFAVKHNHYANYYELYNCNKLNISDKIDDFNSIDFMNLYFTNESIDECEEVINQFLHKTPPSGKFTRGLYYRGLNKNRTEKGDKHAKT